MEETVQRKNSAAQSYRVCATSYTDAVFDQCFFNMSVQMIHISAVNVKEFQEVMEKSKMSFLIGQNFIRGLSHQIRNA
jgi:hypothetical protein